MGTMLLTINPIILIAGMLSVCISGFICAKLFKNTYDIGKSIRCYLPVALVTAIIVSILGIPVIIAAGMAVFGLLVVISVSNYYFYKS